MPESHSTDKLLDKQLDFLREIDQLKSVHTVNSPLIDQSRREELSRTFMHLPMYALDPKKRQLGATY